MNCLFMEKGLNDFLEVSLKMSLWKSMLIFSIIPYQFQSVSNRNKVFPSQGFFVSFLQLNILISINQFSIGEPGFFLQL